MEQNNAKVFFSEFGGSDGLKHIFGGGDPMGNSTRNTREYYIYAVL